MTAHSALYHTVKVAGGGPSVHACAVFLGAKSRLMGINSTKPLRYPVYCSSQLTGRTDTLTLPCSCVPRCSYARRVPHPTHDYQSVTHTTRETHTHRHSHTHTHTHRRLSVLGIFYYPLADDICPCPLRPPVRGCADFMYHMYHLSVSHPLTCRRETYYSLR